jgi:hypothetical protein
MSDHVSDRPTQFETIPQVCLIDDVCRLLRISERQFHYLMARRVLALAELPRFDRKRRFTGESVARVIRLTGCQAIRRAS